MKVVFDLGAIELIPNGRDYEAHFGDEGLVVKLLGREAGRFELEIDGKPVTAYIAVDGPRYWVTINGQTFLLTKSSGGRRGGHTHHAAGELTAPMPGQVRAVNVSEGDPVSKGQTLMLIEAMKMEIRVQSPQEGTVKAVHVRQGQTVEREQLLIEVE